VKAVYPWSAVVGQDALKHALLLCAIDPGIGGVLVQGPRGVAKTTLARALGQLVDGSFVELPLGASEERVTGSLDLDAALRDSKVVFSPGLLARAHQGVLYVDEVNLLPDALVDLLLDAAATGQNSVERDGVSHVHPARFVLVGTMNPEEGELRPQLTDRFGLCVSAAAEIAPLERVSIVERRLAFDADPLVFQERYQSEQTQLIARCRRARACAPQIALVGPALTRVSELCHAARVEGVRADLAMLRAARAHAAWHARDVISEADVEAVAELALVHRRTRPPEPPRSGPRGGSTPPNPGGAATRGPAGESDAGSGSSSSVRSHVEAARAPTSLEPNENSSAGRDHDDSAATQAPARPERGALPAVPVRAAAIATLPGWLTRARGRRAELRRRGRGQHDAPRGRRGRQTDSPSDVTLAAVDWFATLAHTPRPTRADLRYRTRRAPHSSLWVLALDCSASMLRSDALAAAKGVAHALEAQASRAGAHVALLSFSGNSARLEASTGVRRATRERVLGELGAAGGTPLRAALQEAFALCTSRRFRAPEVAKRIVLLTDGRTREPVHDLSRDNPNIELVVIDCERGALRLGRAEPLARALDAHFVHVDSLR
jgi:magnesium chelatase subunit D